MRSRASPRRRRRGAARAGARAAARTRRRHRMRSRARSRSCAAAAPEPRRGALGIPVEEIPIDRTAEIRGFGRGAAAARWAGAAARAGGAAARTPARGSRPARREWIELRGQRARVRARTRAGPGTSPRSPGGRALNCQSLSLSSPSARAAIDGAARPRRHREPARRPPLLGQILGDVRASGRRASASARDLVDRLLGRGRGRHHEERVLAARAAHARAAVRHAGVVELEFGLAALAGDDHATFPLFDVSEPPAGPLEAGAEERA